MSPESTPTRPISTTLLRPPAVRIPDLSTLRKRRLSKSLSSVPQWLDEYDREKFEKEIESKRVELEEKRNNLQWHNSSPVILQNFASYLLSNLKSAIASLSRRLGTVLVCGTILGGFFLAARIEGPQKESAVQLESLLGWFGYWILLGVLSSIGLGTGLHTFVLFLGPHIATVTTTAYQCGNLSFLIRGPTKFLCQSSIPEPLTLWKIYGMVFLESFLWGTGTSIGEMPPYFVARAAASAQRIDDNREEDILEEIAELEKTPFHQLAIEDKAKLVMLRVLRQLGFFGIVLCASIPNPLFDLAGILCGHYMVPFYTFFGATFLGKAVIKSSIQTCIVILVFSRDTIEWTLSQVEQHFPFAHDAASKFVNKQVASLMQGDVGEGGTSLIGSIWNLIIVSMTLYFIASMVKALAKDQLRKEHHAQLDALINARKNAINARSETASPTSTPSRSPTVLPPTSSLMSDDEDGTLEQSMIEDPLMTQSVFLDSPGPPKWDGAASSFL
ncbi:hypothetical protein M427DRAFT_434787 [Gonapodya prolifera JEL478]|uniref:Golgi apparatus membrane protein tvp38 n=1 Tax=Gonapodya prolifera (strain JEL478) TaxID=1344416 RepID=A0A139A3V7_GONPJ|nr:hypothetical protein M427DRAFT_434787 [Gonapodya prolifera JEL478]|eukprot:KXS11506.1 hypothetical protein M427DRAFT_434787 [Gonapodya prolifera JEL478]